MRVRANGLGLRDLDTLAALETGRYWTPAKRPSEAKHRLAINNGYWAEDILTNGLVLYVPLWLYSGAKFPSVDSYKHTCSVIGAIWGPQGRTFDGTDDSFIATSTLFTGTKDVSVKTVGMWVYTPGTADYGALFGVRAPRILDVPQTNWQFYRNSGTSDLFIHTKELNQDTGYNFVTGGWVCVQAVIDGVQNKWDLYINDALFYTKAGYNFGSVSGGGNYAIGFDNDGTYGTGTFGAAWIYEGGQTLAEIKHNYYATRWRYA